MTTRYYGPSGCSVVEFLMELSSRYILYNKSNRISPDIRGPNSTSHGRTLNGSRRGCWQGPLRADPGVLELNLTEMAHIISGSIGPLNALHLATTPFASRWQGYDHQIHFPRVATPKLQPPAAKSLVFVWPPMAGTG